MAKTLRSEIADKFGGAINAQALKACVDEVAGWMEEQKDLSDKIKGRCAEADEAGIASKREIRRLAREQVSMDPEILDAQLDRMTALRAALREFVTTPLGEAAVTAEARAATVTDYAPDHRRSNKPRRFDEQPVTPPRRGPGRPRKVPSEALAEARLHLGEEEPAGTA